MTVSVYNYNLLSTKLCDPSWHLNCNPDHLKTSFRWALLSERFQQQIKLCSIICMQELSEEWICILVPFFKNNNYCFVYDSQWLGVGIAFLNNKYTINSMNLVSVGEIIKKDCKSYTPLSKPIQYLNKVISWFRAPPSEDSWVAAGKKSNRFIGLNLTEFDSKQPFYVFTYHMPCDFKRNDVMNIQAAALISNIQKIAGELPYIVAGDFNSVPTSSVYRMITLGIMPIFPVSKIYKYIPLFSITSLISVYFAFQRREPEYTNYSYTKPMDQPFKETIDYIFCSKMRIEKVLSVRDDLPQTTFPNEQEPSDHLPIGATLEFL